MENIKSNELSLVFSKIVSKGLCWDKVQEISIFPSCTPIRGIYRKSLLITIDHKHNLYINFRLVRITYFHNATVINKSAFLVQPLIFNLFSLRFQTHLSSRVYTTSRIILLYRLAQTIMLFDKYVWL